MYKRLRIYYFYTALPFLLLLTGAAVFSGAIRRTIEDNPHPQINFAIFTVTLIGGLLILKGVYAIMKEARALEAFAQALKAGQTSEELLYLTRDWDAEIAYVLRMLAATVGRSLSHQEQSAIEHELNSAQGRLESHHSLPQFLTSLLVGLGLLGTFVGLLSALGDIGRMVAAFGSLDVESANLMDVFRGMVQRMEAPMASMAIAFSASMFGLLGSIVLGFMMVSARGLVRELHSLLGSEVSQHLNLALAKMGPATLAKVVENMSDVLNGSIDRLVRELEINFSQLSNSMTGVEHRFKTAIDALTGNGGAGSADHPLRELLQEQTQMLMRLEGRLAESTTLQTQAIQVDRERVELQRGDISQMAENNAVLMENLQNSLREMSGSIAQQLSSTVQMLEQRGQDIVSNFRDGGAVPVRLAETPDGLDRLPDLLSRVSNAITLSASRIELVSRELSERPSGGQQLIMGDGAHGGPITVGGSASREMLNEQVDLLRRIDERLAENYRTQSAALQAEFDSINRTRGEMTKVFNDHAESMAMLRSELQRIGRQLGIAHALMERSSTGLLDTLHERFAEQNNTSIQQNGNLAQINDTLDRMAEDAAQNLRVLGEILDRARSSEMRSSLADVIGAIRQVSSLQIDLGMKIEQAQLNHAEQMRDMMKSQREALKSLTNK